MKKLVSLFVLVACVVASSPEPVRAASELETWCVAQEGGWRADTNTCIVLSADAIVTGTLALLSGETLRNFRAIGNHGDIDNFGTIYYLCMSVFLGSPPSNWGGGVTYNLDNCSFMPVVARD